MASSGQQDDPFRSDGSPSPHDRLRAEAEASRVPVEWLPLPDSDPVVAELVLAVAPDPPARREAAFAVEAVLEGFLCHQGSPRLFRPEDEDLALLTGDLLYALGLRAVSSAGETGSVLVLAELIQAAAGLASEGRSQALASLWTAQAVALGEGAEGDRGAVLTRLSDGSDRDGALLLGAASARAAAAGADLAFGRALDALQSMFEVPTGSL